VDYVNEKWCDEKGFPVTKIGNGWIKGFDGKESRTKIQAAEVKFRIQRKFQRRKFRILEETGSDKMVLGMPWLQDTNPSID
jgi:hypothetical protein